MIQDGQEIELNDDTCDAVNCSARATTTISVKTGDRSIAFNLCNNCISKFEDATEKATYLEKKVET